MAAPLQPGPTAGEPDLEALWSAHSGAVVRYSTWLLSGDRHTAEDVAQETALRLWQHPETVRRPGSLHGWLHTVARNIIIDRERKRAARPPESLYPPETLPGATTATSTEDVSSTVLARLSVQTMLDRLDEPHRATVEAVYADGLSLEQAARLLQVPVGTVKSRCHHGLFRLRRQLLVEGDASASVLD